MTCPKMCEAPASAAPPLGVCEARRALYPAEGVRGLVKPYTLPECVPNQKSQFRRESRGLIRRPIPIREQSSWSERGQTADEAMLGATTRDARREGAAAQRVSIAGR